MSRLPIFPLWVDDYLADTTAMTNATEHGAYMLLLFHLWRAGSLPDDEAVLSKIARCTPRQWTKVRPLIAPYFGPGWTHRRVEREREKADSLRNKRATAGSRGGNMKTQNAKEKQIDVSSPAMAVAEQIRDGALQALNSKHKDTLLEESEDILRLADAADKAVANRKADFDRLKRAVWDLLPGECWNTLQIQTLSGLFDLVSEGYDIDREIVPKVRQVVERQPAKVWTSWAYFVTAIRGARRDQQSPAAPSVARVKSYLPVNWDFDAGQLDFAKTCGLREEELNSIRQEMIAWGTKNARDDWGAQVRSKIGAIGQLHLRTKIENEEREAIRREQEARLAESMARHKERAGG